MTCKDCIHYHSIGTLCDKYIYPEERNNNVCDHYNIEVDADAYRICAEMVSKDYEQKEDCWESISK